MGSNTRKEPHWPKSLQPQWVPVGPRAVSGEGPRACCFPLPRGLRNELLAGSQVFLVKLLTAHRHKPQPVFSVFIESYFHFLIDAPGDVLCETLSSPWEIKGPSSGMECLLPSLICLHKALLPGPARLPRGCRVVAVLLRGPPWPVLPGLQPGGGGRGCAAPCPPGRAITPPSRSCCGREALARKQEAPSVQRGL